MEVMEIDKAQVVYRGETTRMMMEGYESTDVVVEDVDLEVWYGYRKGEPGDRDYPGYPDQVEIRAVFVQHTDVQGLLSRDVLNTIESKLFEKCGF